MRESDNHIFNTKIVRIQTSHRYPCRVTRSPVPRGIHEHAWGREKTEITQEERREEGREGKGMKSRPSPVSNSASGLVALVDG